MPGFFAYKTVVLLMMKMVYMATVGKWMVLMQ